MKRASIGAAFAVAVVAILASLPQGAHARDRGVNQPGAVGNPRADPGLNQPGAVGNVGVGAPGVGVGAPGVGVGAPGVSVRDPGVNQPGAVGNRGVAGPGGASARSSASRLRRTRSAIGRCSSGRRLSSSGAASWTGAPTER